jgi:hypothetical protein
MLGTRQFLVRAGIGMQIATVGYANPYRAHIEENGPMRIDQESSLTPRWIVFGTAVVYFALGSLLTAQFIHLKEAWTDNHRAFQMEIHHGAPGKMPALAGRFRSHSRLQAKHRLDLVEYWIPEEAKFTQTRPACVIKR